MRGFLKLAILSILSALSSGAIAQQNPYENLIMCFSETLGRGYFASISSGRRYEPEGKQRGVTEDTKSISLFSQDLNIYTFDKNQLYITPSKTGATTYVINSLDYSAAKKQKLAQSSGRLSLLDFTSRKVQIDHNGMEVSSWGEGKTPFLNEVTLIERQHRSSNPNDLSSAMDLFQKELSRRFNLITNGIVHGMNHTPAVKMGGDGQLLLSFVKSDHVTDNDLAKLKKAYCYCEKAKVDKAVLDDSRDKIYQHPKIKKANGEAIDPRELTCENPSPAV